MHPDDYRDLVAHCKAAYGQSTNIVATHVYPTSPGCTTVLMVLARNASDSPGDRAYQWGVQTLMYVPREERTAPWMRRHGQPMPYSGPTTFQPWMEPDADWYDGDTMAYAAMAHFSTNVVDCYRDQ